MKVRDRTVSEGDGGSAWGRVRDRSFGPASELPYRRRASDWIRLVIGVVLMSLLLAHQNHETQTELDIFNAVHDLPRGFASAVRLFYAIGVVWAIVLVVAAIVTRRRRLARDLFVGGVLTWALGRLIGSLVDGSSFARGLDVFVEVKGSQLEFPAVRVAVIVAVISVASPYLTRPTRRLGQGLVLLMFIAAMYLGASQFDDVLAAVALGWTLAAGVHLVFGSPGGRPTTAQVEAALAELGVEVGGLMLALDQPRGITRMVTADERGALRVRVLGRDEADAQLVTKFWRWLLYREGAQTVHLTRLEEVQSQAYALLLAERAGVRVPEVIVAGSGGPGAVVLLTRLPEGSLTLAEADPAAVTDEQLDELWASVQNLHRGHVVHRRLNARHVVLGMGGVALVDFDHASGTSANSRHLASDVAELLASTAQIVGNDRAVRAAVAGVGRDEVVAAVPVLQPAALSNELRPTGRHEALHRRRFAKQLGELRTTVADATDTKVPPLQELHRVSGGNLLMAVGTLVGLVALFNQVGSPGELWDTISNAHFGWVAVALTASLLTNVGTAIGLMGTVPIHLPLMRTSELQLSMSFSNLAVPAVGGTASQVRFLQKQGLGLSEAVSSGGLLASGAGIVTQVILLVVALWLSPTKYQAARIDTGKFADIALIAILVVIVVVGLVLGIPRIRRAVAAPAKSAASTFWGALRSPRRVALMLVGNIISSLLYSFVYMACIRAFGASVNFWGLTSLNIVIGTLAALVPIPGGGAAVSSVGMSGALAAAGVPIEAAVAAALIDQLVVSYIPAIPGWFATQDLLHADYL